MSGYFMETQPMPRGGDANDGVGTTTSSNNADVAAAILQQLAAAAAQSNNQGTNDDNNQLQAEEVARMGMMLAQLATTGNSNAAPAGNAGIGDRGRAAGDRTKETTAYQRSLFQRGSGGRAAGRNIQNTLPSQQQKMITPISQREQSWYNEERALLRELIVSTMRHSDGTLLRFVPSEEEQLQLWNTHGHPVGNRYAPNVIAEGVRIYPKVDVLPPQSSSNDDDGGYDRGQVRGTTRGRSEDLQFISNLQLPLLGSGARDAISLCGECGWLYERVASYVESVLDDDELSYGVQCATARALASRLDKELSGYHERLSLLEGELPPVELTSSVVQSAASPQDATRYLTLRSLTSRLPPMRDHLRTLAILADGVGSCNLRGGKLLAAVLRHSLDGHHTRHSDLVRSIAADCAVPWYKVLWKWMTHGVLEDVHSEFFVREVKPSEAAAALGYGDGEIVSSSSSGFFTWHRRYVLVEGLIPLCSCGGMMDIITADLAREVLLVGKGINFIRYCLQDKDWEVVEKKDEEVEEASAGYNFTTLMDVVSSNNSDSADELQCVSTLNEAVMQSSARIHSHILESLERRHHLMQHLLALKHFLFLGQGDFVSSFVECLDQELFRGRTSIAGIYAHTLSSVLEGSLRTTNARFLPSFVLGNLRARLMVDSNDPNRYSMGPPPNKDNKQDDEIMTPWQDDEEDFNQDPWNLIYLDYKINSPLDAIVHASAKQTYHQVFLFLFRLKRVEWMLNNSWRQSTALNHAILIETRAGGADAPAISEAAEHSSFLLRRISSTRQTMLHFISNLQNYLMFEVLEGGWEGLVRAVSKARTLDDVIRAHDSYLNEIVDKLLLSNGEGSGESGNGGKSLEDLLRELLSISLNFGKFQDHIFVNAQAGLDKAAKIRRRVEERAEKGDWGRTTLDEDEGKVFLYLADAKLFEFVERTANDFDRALRDLLKKMSKQIDEVDYCNAGLDDDQEGEADGVMKSHDALPFLLFRLDFSGYYARQAREDRKKRKQNS